MVGEGRELVRTYYYNAPVNQKERPEQYKKQQAFFAKLKRNVDYLEIRLGKLVRRKGEMVEKGVDIKLATDLVVFAAINRYDVAIVITADGDFGEAIQHVKNMGKHVELAFPDTQCRHLRSISDKFILLDNSYIKKIRNIKDI